MSSSTSARPPSFDDNDLSAYHLNNRDDVEPLPPFEESYENSELTAKAKQNSCTALILVSCQEQHSLLTEFSGREFHSDPRKGKSDFELCRGM